MHRKTRVRRYQKPENWLDFTAWMIKMAFMMWGLGFIVIVSGPIQMASIR